MVLLTAGDSTLWKMLSEFRPMVSVPTSGLEMGNGELLKSECPGMYSVKVI